MAMRDKNTDNGKLDGKPLTKAMASVQMPMWPTMGAWKPPGQTQVPPSTAWRSTFGFLARPPML